MLWSKVALMASRSAFLPGRPRALQRVEKPSFNQMNTSDRFLAPDSKGPGISSSLPFSRWWSISNPLNFSMTALTSALPRSLIYRVSSKDSIRRDLTLVWTLNSNLILLKLRLNSLARMSLRSLTAEIDLP
ncbi:hypothetical protein Salat_2631400 [Sesamum alatum]|uniref:Uncharacterized protein n=1 Tax=Sesamum alatum TaxID=300844 RepID=A0AAE1XNS7_9LAMI|nr:hypothetical protein Salat_2631400 [Sesamum alatum]